MAKKSRIVAVNDEYVAKIMPILESWGLARHPDPSTWFGRSEHGYLYEFADVRDPNDVRLCRFSIAHAGRSISVRADRGMRIDSSSGATPHQPANPGGFVLTRPFSFRHMFKRFMDVTFQLEQRRNEPIESAAARLMEDVVEQLPRLKRYLYG